MGTQPDPFRATGQEVQRRQRLVVRLVGPECGHAVSSIGVKRFNLAGQDDVVADPYRFEPGLFRGSGQSSQPLRAGHRAPAG